jgi:hypothetical protein
MLTSRAVSASVSLYTGIPVQRAQHVSDHVFVHRQRGVGDRAAGSRSSFPRFFKQSFALVAQLRPFKVLRRQRRFLGGAWTSVIISIKVGGVRIGRLFIRRRLPASSIRSIALSGKKRSEMYRSARLTAATRA